MKHPTINKNIDSSDDDDEIEGFGTSWSYDGGHGDYTFDIEKESMFAELAKHPLLSPFVAAGIKLEDCYDIKCIENWGYGGGSTRWYATMPELTLKKLGGCGRGGYDGSENIFQVIPDASTADPRKMFVFLTICRLALYPLIEMPPSAMMLHECGCG